MQSPQHFQDASPEGLAPCHWLPLASIPLGLTSKGTSAQGQKTHVVLCHRTILKRTLHLCHFYEVSA